MDSNYEAQKQLTRQRLSARREQASAERLLREGRPARLGGVKQFLMHLFAPIGLFHRSGLEKRRDVRNNPRQRGWQ
jgi:hypothetical protein